MAIYIDASALIPLIVVEPDSGWSQSQVYLPTQVRLVSDFAAAEVAATISKFVRMTLITPDAAHALLGRFDTWRGGQTVALETTAVDIVEATRLVRRFELKLRAPDALHLALAGRHEAKLVSRDQGMARAAHMIGLPVAVPA